MRSITLSMARLVQSNLADSSLEMWPWSERTFTCNKYV